MARDNVESTTDRIPILRAMVRLSIKNGRRVKEPKKVKKRCEYCRRTGGKYIAAMHPSNADCAGTGVATVWR